MSGEPTTPPEVPPETPPETPPEPEFLPYGTVAADDDPRLNEENRDLCASGAYYAAEDGMGNLFLRPMREKPAPLEDGYKDTLAEQAAAPPAEPPAEPQP